MEYFYYTKKLRDEELKAEEIEAKKLEAKELEAQDSDTYDFDYEISILMRLNGTKELTYVAYSDGEKSVQGRYSSYEASRLNGSNFTLDQSLVIEEETDDYILVNLVNSPESSDWVPSGWIPRNEVFLKGTIVSQNPKDTVIVSLEDKIHGVQTENLENETPVALLKYNQKMKTVKIAFQSKDGKIRKGYVSQQYLRRN